MADVDEDVVAHTGASGGEEVDLSDETQDFRFLASISREDAKIPKRGEKDFEPHSTALQSNTLAASRQAMHAALSFQRVHTPKSYTRAIYHPETNMAYTVNPKGPLFTRMGHVKSAGDDPFAGMDGEMGSSRGNRVWLLPEEVLYLLERGTVDVRWPPIEDEDAAVDGDDGGLPMSLQGAYAVFIGDEASHKGALTMERYSVYSALKRAGYTVQRAPSWDGPGDTISEGCYPPPTPPRSWSTGLFGFKSLWTRLSAISLPANRSQGEDPLVKAGLYRNYPDIYRLTSLIKYYDPTSPSTPQVPALPTTDPDFRVTYHVWKPGSSIFKKSAPGPPDFRIAVVNARETSVPTLTQLSSLMETVPYHPPKEDAQLYQKLKHGYKNVILAIVDQGVTSYLRVADAGFGREKLYERKAKGGGKRGGRGKGRGRGR